MASFIPRSPLPQANVQPGPSIRNNVRVDLSPAIGAMQGVTKQATALFEQAQERADLTAVMQARRELSDWEGQTWRPDNPDGIAKYKGKDALGAPQALLGDLDTRIGDIRGRLNQRQQARFEQVSGSFRESVQTRLNNHAEREYSGYEAAERKATLDNIGQDAVNAGMAGDYGLADIRIQEALGIARAAAMSQGYGEEAIKASERGIVSSVRKQTALAMATGTPLSALDYYNRHADEMTPEDRAQVQRVIQPVVDDAAAQAEAQAIIAGATPTAWRDPGARGGPAPEIAKIIDEEADAAGVPREYLYALAEQESSFRPGAVNPEVLDDGDQATGLFQYRQISAGGIDRKDARASARRAAQEFKARMAKGGEQYAIAAHFAGEGGAEAVVNRGRRAENPKTARYITEVMGRAERWRGRAAEQGDATVATDAGATSQADAIARAQKIADPGRRRDVIAKINQQYALENLRESEATKARDEATNLALSQGDPTRPLREIIGAQAYAQYERDGKIDTLERIRQHRIAGTFVQDDPVLVEQISREMVTDPAAFMKRNFNDPDLQAKLSTPTLARFKQAAASGSRDAGAGKPEDWATDAERMDRGFVMLGIGSDGDAKGKNASKKNEEREAQRGHFRLAYQQAEREFIQRTGKKPSPEQADMLMRTMARTFAENQKNGTTGIYSDYEKYSLQISEADRMRVRQAYTAKYGRAPTDSWVTRYIIAARRSAEQ